MNNLFNNIYRKNGEHFCKFCRWWDYANQKGKRADCNVPLPEWIDNDRSNDRGENDGLDCEAFSRKAEKNKIARWYRNIFLVLMKEEDSVKY